MGGVVVPTQAFGVADTVSLGFTDGPGDGILGLSLLGTLSGMISSFLFSCCTDGDVGIIQGRVLVLLSAM